MTIFRGEEISEPPAALGVVLKIFSPPHAWLHWDGGTVLGFPGLAGGPGPVQIPDSEPAQESGPCGLDCGGATLASRGLPKVNRLLLSPGKQKTLLLRFRGTVNLKGYSQWENSP